jgi:hypothetical protein
MLSEWSRPVKDSASTSLSTQLPFKERCWVGLVGAILFYALLPSAAFAEPPWWSQMKAACHDSGGDPAADDYNGWVSGGGCVCGGHPSNQPTCSASTSSSTTGSGSDTSDLAGVISTGMRGMTPQQTLGVGIAVLAISALMQGPDPQQQAADQAAEAARQAQIQQQQQQQQQQQEQQRQQQERRAEQTKQELLRSLKGTGASADLAFKDTGAGADLQFKTGDAAPAAKTVIHNGFSLPPLEPSPE